MRLEEAVFVSVDVETTGLDAGKDEIVAIAAVPIKGMKIQVGQAYYTTIRPKRYRIQGMKYHGISEEDLEKAPSFESLAPKLFHLCDGILVGHCVGIDYQFLNKAFGECGLRFHRRLVDIAQLEKWIGQKESRRKSPEELSLDALMARYGLKEYYRHHALADAFFAAQIFQIQVLRYGIESVERLFSILENQKICDVHFIC